MVVGSTCTTRAHGGDGVQILTDRSRESGLSETDSLCVTRGDFSSESDPEAPVSTPFTKEAPVLYPGTDDRSGLYAITPELPARLPFLFLYLKKHLGRVQYSILYIPHFILPPLYVCSNYRSAA